MNYSEIDRERALDVSFIDICQYFGYNVVRIGRYYSLKEMDSIRIYNDKTYYRWSDKTGGTVIDFLMNFCGYDNVLSCIKFLLEFQNIDFERKEIYEIKNCNNFTSNELILPKKNQNYKCLYAYLMNTRKISKETIDYFVKNNFIYEESKYHNIVFCGYDHNNKIKYAAKHGTNTYHSIYKGDCAGSDKNIGFSITNNNLDELYVFEAPIDLMSYIDLSKKYSINAIALGGVADNALKNYLENNKNISCINLFLDSDEPGIKAMYEIFDKYNEDYIVKINLIRDQNCKDINDLLKNCINKRIDNINDFLESSIYTIEQINNNVLIR